MDRDHPESRKGRRKSSPLYAADDEPRIPRSSDHPTTPQLPVGAAFYPSKPQTLQASERSGLALPVSST